MKRNSIYELLFYIVIILVVSASLTYLCFNKKIHPSAEISSTAIAAIVGYSFTALFFLMALPRTGFIQQLDKNGTLIFYAIFIGFPALTGTIYLVLTSLCIALNLSLLFFFNTIIYFLLSLLFIFIIMIKYRQATKNRQHRSI